MAKKVNFTSDEQRAYVQNKEAFDSAKKNLQTAKQRLIEKVANGLRKGDRVQDATTLKKGNINDFTVTPGGLVRFEVKVDGAWYEKWDRENIIKL